MLLQSVYAIVDLAFVGRLGETAVAGLSISFQVFFIVLACGQILAATALANVSQAWGARRFEQATGTFSALTLLSVGVGIVVGAIALASADLYVRTYTDDPATIEQALAYYRINCATFVTQILLIVLGNGMRGSGDFVTPMRVMAVSVLCNMVLDPLLIFGVGPFPRMEVAGAALATVLSQAAGLAYYVTLLLRPSDTPALRLGRPVFDRDLGTQIMQRGAPAGVQFFLMSVLMGIILGAMKPHGPVWTATAGGGFRVVQQSILPMVALASAAAAMSGQNFGARAFGRVHAASWTAVRWALLYASAIAVALFFGGGVFGRIFAQTDDLHAAVVYFRWSAPLPIAFAMTFVPTFVMQAMGRAVLPMSAAIARLVVLAVLVFAVLPHFDVGPAWVFGAATASAFVEGTIDILALRSVLRRRCPTDAAPDPTEAFAEG